MAGKYHPIVQRIQKMTPEEIVRLSHKLAASNAPLPNIPALNPALQALQRMQAAGQSPFTGAPAGGAPAAAMPPAAPVSMQPSVETGSPPTMAQEGANLGTTSATPVRGRNPYTAFGSN